MRRRSEATAGFSAARSQAARSRTRRAAIPAGADAVCEGLTVSWEVRYVDGAEGDRVASAQADAIAALLEWLAHRDGSPPARDVDLADTDDTGDAGGEDDGAEEGDRAA